MASDPEQIAGVLLCRAGGRRLAFPASQVAAVEAWMEGEPLPHARHPFVEHAPRGRVLISLTGDGVVVDAIEVFPEPVAVLPAPPMLAREAGGSLSGFAAIRQELWPVLKLAEFSLYLSTLEGELA